MSLLQENYRRSLWDWSGDPARTKNQAALSSQGTFLTFIDPLDHWTPGRLETIESHLKKHDFLLATVERDKRTNTNLPTLSNDWVSSLLQENWTVDSSFIIRRKLFNEMGGFSEQPKKGLKSLLPKVSDSYEFALKTIYHLSQSGQKDRIYLHSNKHIATSIDGEHQPKELLTLKAIEERAYALREAYSAIRATRNLPKHYWPVLLNTVKNAGKKVLKKDKG